MRNTRIGGRLRFQPTRSEWERMVLPQLWTNDKDFAEDCETEESSESSCNSEQDDV